MFDSFGVPGGTARQQNSGNPCRLVCNVAGICCISSLVEAYLMGVVSNLASTHLSAAALKLTWHLRHHANLICLVAKGGGSQARACLSFQREASPREAARRHKSMQVCLQCYIFPDENGLEPGLLGAHAATLPRACRLQL